MLWRALGAAGGGRGRSRGGGGMQARRACAPTCGQLLAAAGCLLIARRFHAWIEAGKLKSLLKEGDISWVVAVGGGGRWWREVVGGGPRV